MHHADLYRLERTGELADLGIAELVESGGVALVEWGDVVGDDIGDGLTITLSHVEGSDDSRRIEIGWRGKQWESRWDKLRSSLARWSA
jgi:tRNA threonylcarbamoyladenosine biosynthesis protein TsaE